jgi:hypothetical protein
MTLALMMATSTVMRETTPRLVDTNAPFRLENMMKDISKVRFACPCTLHMSSSRLLQFDDLFGGVFDGDSHAFQVIRSFF